MKLTAHHPFKSAKAREDYLAACDSRAQRWPVAVETRMVETPSGQTFVRISGPAEAPPLFLFPGAGTSSLLWEPFIETLSACHRTYAVDNLWDIGRSVYQRPLTKADDYVGWLDELFTALVPGQPVHLMGVSLGAWMSYLYAVRFPSRVAKAVLLSAPGVLGLSWMFMFRILLSAANRGLQRNFVNWIFEDSVSKDKSTRRRVEEFTNDGYLATRILVPHKIVYPRVLSDEELRGLKMPMLALYGEHEKICRPRKAVRRLNIVAPRIKTEIIPGAGHDLLSQAELVSRKAVEFLRQR
jgi:pimeloyl-ACP methyl ester carboxylesterase